MDKSSLALLGLLRSSLGCGGCNGDVASLTGSDWSRLVDVAFDGGVAALAVDGLQRGLAHDNDDDNDNKEGLELVLDSPELEDLKYEWFGEVMHSEDDYQRYKAVIESLAGILSEHNQRLNLLKDMRSRRSIRYRNIASWEI